MLQPGDRVLLHSLASRPELNGRVVIVGHFLPEKGRYRVILTPQGGDGQEEEALIKAENLLLQPGAQVMIQGLQSAKDINGETGSITRFIKERGRYEVRIEGQGMRLIAVKPANVRVRS